jgi:hypothetical protein
MLCVLHRKYGDDQFSCVCIRCRRKVFLELCLQSGVTSGSLGGRHAEIKVNSYTYRIFLFRNKESGLKFASDDYAIYSYVRGNKPEPSVVEEKAATM